MVAADILSSEAKVVTDFFMTESSRTVPEPAELGGPVDATHPPQKTQLESKPEDQSPRAGFVKNSDGQDQIQKAKPDLFVIEGRIIRKSIGAGK